MGDDLVDDVGDDLVDDLLEDDTLAEAPEDAEDDRRITGCVLMFPLPGGRDTLLDDPISPGLGLVAPLVFRSAIIMLGDCIWSGATFTKGFSFGLALGGGLGSLDGWACEPVFDGRGGG